MELEELLAQYSHDTWSDTMQYVFNLSLHNTDGTITIPHQLVDVWTKKMNMQYSELSESEKKRSKKEAAKIISIIGL